VSGQAILSAGNSGKLLGGGRAPPRPNPAGELTALPGPPSWWGGGRYPLPRDPTPAFDLRPFGRAANEKSRARPCATLWYCVETVFRQTFIRYVVFGGSAALAEVCRLRVLPRSAVYEFHNK